MYYRSDNVSNACTRCGNKFAMQRADKGYTTCLPCGDRQARQERAHWCVAPIGNKQGYTLHRSADTLKQINPKQSERWT